jgi:hypothetical protein
LHCAPGIVRVTKHRRAGRAEQCGHAREIKSAYKILIEKPEEKISL